MGTHFHEHHSEIIAWPWKLFCQKWCRLIIAAEREQERRRRDREKREEEQAKRDLMAAHNARVGALDR